MDNDLEDTLSTPNSWLPLKAIKKIMGIKDAPKLPPTVPSHRFSPCIQGDIPNKSTNRSSSFMRLHNKYKNSSNSKEKHVKTNSQEDMRLKEREDYIKTLEKKLKSSESEASLLRHRVKHSEKEISELNKLVTAARTEGMIKIQNLQEQHERKLLKTKKDIDYLLKEMNNKSNLIILDDFIRIHLREMENCRQNYEEILKNFLKQLSKREGRGNASNKEFISSMSKNIEEKLDCELNDLRERYESQIERLKELVTSESLEAYYEDEISTGLNSERATCELKGSILENTLKMHPKSSKSSFFHN